MLSIFRTFCILLTSLAGTGDFQFARATEDFQFLSRAAKEASESGNLKLAVQHLRTATQLKPDEPAASETWLALAENLEELRIEINLEEHPSRDPEDPLLNSHLSKEAKDASARAHVLQAEQLAARGHTPQWIKWKKAKLPSFWDMDFQENLDEGKEETFKKDGIWALKSGEYRAAVQSFMVGAKYKSHRPDVWEDVALALFEDVQAQALSLSTTPDASSDSGRFAGKMLFQYCEAHAALDVSSLLASDAATFPIQLLNAADEAWRTIDSLLKIALSTDDGLESKSAFPEKEVICSSLWGPVQAKQHNALQMISKLSSRSTAENEGTDNVNFGQQHVEGNEAIKLHLESTRLACNESKSITLKPSPSEILYQVFSPSSMRFILSAFRLCGLCVLSDVFKGSSHAFQTIVQAQKRLFSEIEVEITVASQSRNEGQHLETSNISARGHRRFEVKMPLQPPFTSERFVANPLLLAPARAVLSDALEVDTFSSVVSLPGARAGNWHADAGPIFPVQQSGAGFHLPPHGLVAIIPLLNLTQEMGPTEFMAGSHVQLQFGFWRHFTEKDAPCPILQLEIPLHSALLFDLRLRHRGGPNLSIQPRPIIYASYVEGWWRDNLNFKAKQTKEVWSPMSPRMKKLFQRLDQTQYVEHLERLVEKMEGGKDVLDKLRDQSHYKQSELHA